MGSAFKGRTRKFRCAFDYKQLAVKMNAEQGVCLPADDTDLEYRVKVTSKKDVTEQLNKYKKVLETVFDGQPDVEEQIKRVLLQELLAVSHSNSLNFFSFFYSL